MDNLRCQELWDIRLRFSGRAQITRCFTFQVQSGTSKLDIEFPLAFPRGSVNIELTSQNGLSCSETELDPLVRRVRITANSDFAEGDEINFCYRFELAFKQLENKDLYIELKYPQPPPFYGRRFYPTKLDIMFHYPVGFPPYLQNKLQKLAELLERWNQPSRHLFLRLLQSIYMPPWGYKITFLHAVPHREVGDYGVNRRIKFDLDARWTRKIVKQSEWIAFIVAPRYSQPLNIAIYAGIAIYWMPDYSLLWIILALLAFPFFQRGPATLILWLYSKIK